MKVSIGIPMFNCESTIVETVQSVFAQTYQDWDLILMDDGSTDRTLEIVQQIKDPRVRVISDGRNLHLSHRLNQLAQLSSGHLTARMDGDDLMHPERIAKQVEYFKRHPTCHVLGTMMYLIDKDSNLKGKAHCQRHLPRPADIIRTSMFFHPTIMARADWYRSNHYDASYVRAEDMAFWCRTCIEGKTIFGFLPEPLLFYRKSGIIPVEKTILSYRTQRRICLNYGPKLGGTFNTWKNYVRCYFLEHTHRVLHFLRLRERVIRMRDVSIPSFEHAYATRILKHIKSCPVPGWHDSLIKAA